MGQFEAGKWILIIFLYFVLLIFIVDAAEQTQTVIDVTANGTDLTKWAITAACENPRSYYDSTSLEVKEYKSRGSMGRLECSKSIGVLSQNECEAIEGCEWNNTLDSWFIFSWGSANDTCIGEINATFYGIDVRQSTIWGDNEIKPHNKYTAWESFNIKSISPCDHQNVVLNETLCNLFSCNWEEVDYTEKFSSPATILKTMGTVFTFKYDFGINNSLISSLLNVLLIFLPLIALGIAVYFSLPLIH